MLRLVIVACFLCLANNVLAECECLWGGSFVDVQAATDLVVVGTIVSRRGNSVDIEVERRLRGDEEFSPLRVWLRTGDYCRPPVDIFPPGSEWVMALNRIDTLPEGGFNPSTPNVSFGRVGDYSLSSCGGYFLERGGDWVSGNLVDAPRWEYQPQMTPVLLDLVAGHMEGRVSRESLKEASQEDPALRELILDTKAFLRNENQVP
ncbi:MAG: delta-aminolevulinic acid dehydratase [Halioglobus sp.]|nr:delta-aminolevulinic acid dehydratase [Halioglobus sp.]